MENLTSWTSEVLIFGVLTEHSGIYCRVVVELFKILDQLFSIEAVAVKQLKELSTCTRLIYYGIENIRFYYLNRERAEREYTF